MTRLSRSLSGRYGHHGFDLTVGHPEGHKDPLSWIKVANQVLNVPGLEGTRFVWLGEGALHRACINQILKLRLEKRVSFPGNVQDVSPYCENADVYLQLIQVESLGLGVLNAARRGIPQIVTNVGGLGETLEHQVSGIVVDRGNTKAAVLATLGLLGDATMRFRLGSSARKRYARLFSVEQWENRWLQILTAVDRD